MSWPLHPDVIIWMVVLEGGYLALARRGMRRYPLECVVTRRQLILYSSGVFVLWVAAGTPIHDWGEQYLFSVHMFQHLLISMVAPPLLLLGLPGWMIRPFLTRQRIFQVAKFLTLPLIAFVFFNAVTVISHLPPVMDFILRNHPWHFVAHVLLFAAATLGWWPVFSPLADLPRLSFAGQMIYLFVMSLIPSIIGSFMTYGGTILYPFYEQAPRRWGLSPLQDQLIAGLIMKLFGGAIIFGIMTAVFFRWYNQEQRDHPDPLEAMDATGYPPLDWNDVENELERMGLTRTK